MQYSQNKSNSSLYLLSKKLLHTSNMNLLISYLKDNKIDFDLNVDLRKKTWIHRGGIAKVYIKPNDSFQLYQVSRFLFLNKIQFLVVGHTSNLYILNSTNLDVVVSTIKCNKYIIKDSIIECEAGASVIKISKDMVTKGIRGFEYLTGLPGTVAAALYNNSSCHNNSISKLLIKADVMLSDGTLKTFYHDDFHFNFRTSIFKENVLNGVIISVVLKAEYTNSERLKTIARQNDLDRKRILEDKAPNLGCTVNRPFVNGKMHFLLYTLSRIYNLGLYFLPIGNTRKNILRRNFLCFISGYNDIKQYISPKNPIIFMWVDEKADVAFPRYLEFMKKVYKTDKVEIEVIDGIKQ